MTQAIETLTAAQQRTVRDSILVKSRKSETLILGDSIDGDVSGFFYLLCINSQQKMTFRRNSGIGGNTTTQMLARIQADVIDYAPDVCILGGPTNDHTNSTSEATTRANYQAMADTLRLNGITVVVRNCPPVDIASSSGDWDTIAKRRNAVTRHNVWLENWGRAEDIPVLDIFTPLSDPATEGAYASGLNLDTVHPNGAGSLAAANWILNVQGLPDCFRGSVQLPSGKLQDGWLLNTNPVFLGDANSDGVADGWTYLDNGSATVSLVSADSPAIGNWQKIVTSTTDWAQVYADPTGLVIGEDYEVVCRLKSTTNGLLLRVSNGADIGPLKSACEGIGRVRFTATATSGSTHRIAVHARDFTGAEAQVTQLAIRKLS